MKKVLIVASTSGFIKGFLLSDAKMLQELGYEVHCAANHKAMVTFKAEELFPKYNIIFHQVDQIVGSVKKWKANVLKRQKNLVLLFHIDK